jgi:hypothetical protein
VAKSRYILGVKSVIFIDEVLTNLGDTILDALNEAVDLTAAVFTNLVDLDCVKIGTSSYFRFLI